MTIASVMGTEYFDGAWHVPDADGPEPLAVVTYTDEPSPETGHVGWCWWALGKMGDADSYDDARGRAESSLRATDGRGR
jgi:hypothetical protein